MGLETGTYISDLVTTNPLGSDAKSTADDHLRLIKSCLKTTFPSVTGAVTMTHTELNTVTSRGLIAGQTWTGTHTFPATTYGVTATLGDSSLKYATTEFVANTAFSSALPAQLGNSGKLLTTNGTAASWSSVKTVNSQSILGSGDIPIGMTLLATITPTAAANIDALTTFSSSYDNYLIIGTGLSVAADDTFRFRFAVAGSVDSGSNYYTADSYTVAAITASSTSGIVASTTTSAGIGANFAMRIYNANDATRLKTAFSEHSSQSAATPAYIFRGAATVYTAANAVSGIRLFLLGGANFGATGKIRIFGYQNS